jgi:hypothetical protein
VGIARKTFSPLSVVEQSLESNKFRETIWETLLNSTKARDGDEGNLAAAAVAAVAANKNNIKSIILHSKILSKKKKRRRK